MNNFIDNYDGTPECPKMKDNPFMEGDSWLNYYEELFNIKLGEEQIAVLHDSINVILNNINQHCFTEPVCIGGAAGVGKSIITKFLLNWSLNKYIDTVLCAPTHKAVLVLKDYNNYDTTTIHSLLALSPKIDILQLDIRELQFFTSKTKSNHIPYKGLIICDEASMVSSDLFDLLVEKCNALSTQLIFIADYAQLNPVKEEKLSKVFTCKNQFRLTKIYRQSEKSALTGILQTLRDTPIYEWKNCSGEEGSLLIEHDLKSFCNNAVSEYKQEILNKNILHTKILAFTNKRVGLYNQVIHKFLYGDKNFLNPGELLMAYENFDFEGNKIINAMDYIVENVETTFINIPYYKKVSGYNVTVYDEYTDTSFDIPIIAPEECSEELAVLIETIRVNAINSSGRAKAINWSKYYSIMESFCSSKALFIEDRCIRKATFQYGYAITVHKSQGSSYDNIFLDMKDILRAKDKMVLRQLQYVGLSRTRGNANVLL